MDPQDPASGENWAQWHAGPEGDWLPDRVRGACDEARQVAAGGREGVRVHRAVQNQKLIALVY